MQTLLATSLSGPLRAAFTAENFTQACEILSVAVEQGEMASAVLHVAQGEHKLTKAFGKARSEAAVFLLGSISKPVAMTGLMTLFDQGAFHLDDPLKKFIPGFSGGGREAVTLRNVLTHVSGLPDQLPENETLRRGHSPLSAFIDHALRVPLQFTPGSRFEYSSMGVLLAAHVGEIITGSDILSLVQKTVLEPLGMRHSAQGMGRFTLGELEQVQTNFAAPEAGGGAADSKDWGWNSAYWRALGAPWGGTHAAAPDIGTFLAEFLYQQGRVLKADTARLMIRNHNSAGECPRGLAFNVGTNSGSPGCSERTFGHTGSTGTMAWADPETQTICVVLTSLPGNAVQPHPRDLASAKIATAAR